MCDVRFWGIPVCVTKCDRGRGSKLTKNNVTYFMEGPLGLYIAEKLRSASASPLLHFKSSV